MISGLRGLLTASALAASAVALLLVSGCGHSQPRALFTPSDNEGLRPQHVFGGHAALPNVSATGSCGVELWSIKTLTDPQSSQVNLTPVRTTIADLVSPTEHPPPPDSFSRLRDAPTETTTWQVAATLTGFKLEADSDYHLVLDDGSGHTMIAEIPDPACASGSPVASAINEVRNALEQQGYNAGSECFNCLSRRVTVDGVGFFDRLHGQNGVAPNGIELHPVLAISFDANPPPPPPTTSAATTSSTATTTTVPSPQPTPGRHDADHAADARECPTFIPRSDRDLRDDIRERRTGVC